MANEKARNVWEVPVAVVGILAALVAFLVPGWPGLSIVLLASLGILVVVKCSGYFRAGRWIRAKRKIYRGVIQSDYLKWQQAILEALYHELEFACLFGTKYPAAILRPENVIEYPFNGLCELTSVSVPQLEFDKRQKQFIKILGSSVRAPKMKGFALSRTDYTPDKKTRRFHAVTINQAQNLVTCHILEWELFKYFSRCRGRLPKEGNDILSYLPYRAKVHDHRSAALAVAEPHNAYPLISVQALVMFRDNRAPGTPLWRVVLAKRSEKVVVKPGFLQFVPAGGFEVYGGQGDDYEYLIRQGFDVGDALLREYAEELFNAEDLEENPAGHDPISIRSHPAVHQLLLALKAETAWIEFLGTTIDLTVLRPEFSFLILIEDEFFCNTAILGNWESKNVMAPSLQELRVALSDGRLHGSSAGLLQLALESKRLHQLNLVTLIESQPPQAG